MPAESREIKLQPSEDRFQLLAEQRTLIERFAVLLKHKVVRLNVRRLKKAIALSHTGNRQIASRPFRFRGNSGTLTTFPRRKASRY